MPGSAAHSDAKPTSPLDAVVRRHGATMINRHGRSVAAHFGSATSEAAVCVSTVGLADRSDRTTFELHGAPQDIELALAALAQMNDRAWWKRITSRTAIVRCEYADTSTCASAMIPADGTLVVNVSDRYAAIAVIGPRAGDLLGAAVSPPGPQPIVLQDGSNTLEVLVEAASGPALWAHMLEAGAPFQVACVGLDALDHLAASRRVGGAASATVR